MSEPHEGATRVLAPVVPSEMPSARAVLRVGTAIVALDGTEPAPVILGSGPACTVRLADTSVSRRHCSVELVADGLRVRDLESTNGTFLNGVRIESAYAPHGASLRFGQTEVFVTLVSGQAEALPAVSAFGGLLGRSTELRRLHPLLRRIAAASLPVLIEGETGTGKEIAAEALHSEGPRREGPFVVLDCTTIPAQLAESELFGHERGAFTGASSKKRGAFEMADGGTIFIDEIGDLELSLQAKLLRVLDRGEFRRVGSEKSIKVDVRVVAATRRNLDTQVAQGSFRDDLYHRLVAARVVLPPLRQRKGDVELLVDHFCRQEGFDPAEVPASVRSAWNASGWPGNIRELRQAVRRFVALGDALIHEPTAAVTATGEDFFTKVLSRRLPLPEARRLVADEFEERYVRDALARARGNVSEAARSSGIARRHFHTLKERSVDRDEE